jgi:hypothetical protein
MLDRMLSVVVSVSLALLVWLYARSRDQEILDNVPIPVQVSIAAAQADMYTLEMTGPSQVTVSFTGPPARIRELRGMLQRNELHANFTLSVPEERQLESRYSDTIHVDSSDIHAPPGVTPIILEGRNRVPVTLHRMTERRLPVQFVNAQDEPTGPLVLDPPSVLVRGPQEVLERLRAIATVPSLLPIRPVNAPPTAAAVGRVSLEEVVENRPVRVTPNKITVRVPAQARRQYEIPEVPVQFMFPPTFPLRPQFTDDRSSRITLKIEGPVQDDPPKVTVFIDLTKVGLRPGKYAEPAQIQLPKDFALVPNTPPEVSFELLPIDFGPKGSSMVSPPQ